MKPHLWYSFRLAIVFGLIFLIILTLSSCFNIGGNPTSQSPAHLKIVSVSGVKFNNSFLGFTVKSLDAPNYGWGAIDSGPAEYIKIKLERIELVGTFDGGSNSRVIWDNPNGVEITVSGTGNVNLSGVPDIQNLPLGEVTGVNITINCHGKFCGELTNAQFNGLNLAHLYTKSNYAYNAFNQTGGADDYTYFQNGPAEETDVYFGADSEAVIINTPVNYTLVQGATPALTILVDLSRMLRFYNGLGTSGPNPIDLSNKAYFFCHSLFCGGARPIACFFGNVGSIQGYQVICSVNGHCEIPAWMTLIFNSSDEIQSGFLIGDDDNALTVAKGNILQTPIVPVAGNYDFNYDISGVTVTGFQKKTVLDTYSEANWDQTIDPFFTGTSRFILKLQL
ncbi:MAG: hypothetical protein K6U80_06105 [Firmicutes bacterium]|nr:hypothetical protein [Bacillota bacterium]